MRFHWEAVDDWRPPTLKHVPHHQRPALNKARAQRTNNALLALSFPQKSISARNRDARNHRLFRSGRFPQVPDTVSMELHPHSNTSTFAG